MANVNVTLNNEKNGVEIRFDGKPEAAVIESLKENGFRWSGKQKMWYAKQTDEVMAFVNTVWKDAVSKHPCGGSSVTIKNKTEKHEIKSTTQRKSQPLSVNISERDSRCVNSP